MPETTVNGVETHYEVNGEGTPALFIHGGFGGARTTLVPGAQAILDAAPLDRVQVITYDRRCAGASEYTIDDAYDLEDIAADGQALLTHLGIERAIIIGSSMGGMVAQQFALSFPGTVSALALLNTGPRLMFETPWGKNSSALVDRVESEGAEAVFEGERAALREPPEPPQRANPSPLAEQAAAGRLRYIEAVKAIPDEDLFRYWRGTVRNYAAFIGFDFVPRLHEIAAIDAPKVIVHGDADSVVPFSDAEALRDGIGEIEFHAIPDADHGITAYPAAQGVIRDWLTRIA
jgi:pimeloyl-ACP methyl ester carboxylesterase